MGMRAIWAIGSLFWGTLYSQTTFSVEHLYFELEGESSQAEGLGSSLARAGDLNGDGIEDIVAGAPNADDGSGRVYFFSGSNGDRICYAFGCELELSEITSAHPDSKSLGYVVAGVGDVNSDGYDDVAISIKRNLIQKGQVVIISGRDGSELFYRTHQGTFGFALKGLGDVDGDGIDDFAIGHPYYLTNLNTGAQQGGTAINGAGTGGASGGTPAAVMDSGRLWVYRGGASLGELLYQVPPLQNTSQQYFQPEYWDRDYFGSSIEVLEDLNGDGAREILVGATLKTPPSQGFPPNSNGSGYVRILSGRDGATIPVRNAQTGVISTEIRGEQARDRFGHSIAHLGDFQGQNNAFVVGAPHYDGSNGAFENSGAIFRVGFDPVTGDFTMSRTDPTNSNEFLGGGPSFAQSEFGFSLASLGDIASNSALQSDGAPDFIIGAPGFATGSGTAILISGLHWTENSQWQSSSQPVILPGSQAGYALSALSDLNCDGVNEFVLGARSYDQGLIGGTGVPGSGRVAVYSVSDLTPRFEQTHLNIQMSVSPIQTFSYQVDPQLIGKEYLLSGSASGSSPGFQVQGHHIPLNEPDPWLDITVNHANTGGLFNTRGPIGCGGRGEIQIDFSSMISPPSSPQDLYHVLTVFDSLSAQISEVTGALVMSIQ